MGLEKGCLCAIIGLMKLTIKQTIEALREAYDKANFDDARILEIAWEWAKIGKISRKGFIQFFLQLLDEAHSNPYC